MSCQAKSKPHATETLAAVLSVCWLAPLEATLYGTIVANPRRRRGAGVASFRCVCWRDLPTHRCVGCRSVLRCGDHVFTFVSEDLERFVEDRSQRVHTHHTQWDRKNSAISRFPTWPAVVFSTRSTSSSSLALKFSSLISRKISDASNPTRLFPSTNG